MRVIIAGSQGFTDYELLAITLDEIDYCIEVIMSGTASGADTLGEQYAKENKITLERSPVDWNTLELSTQYIRNIEMVRNADMLVAFWDGSSRGTRHMINIAKDRKLIVKVVMY